MEKKDPTCVRIKAIQSIVHSILSPGKMYALKSALELHGKIEWKQRTLTASNNQKGRRISRSIFNAYVHQKICIRASSNIFFFVSHFIITIIIFIGCFCCCCCRLFFSISLRFFSTVNVRVCMEDILHKRFPNFYTLWWNHSIPKRMRKSHWILRNHRQ